MAILLFKWFEDVLFIEFNLIFAQEFPVFFQECFFVVMYLLKGQSGNYEYAMVDNQLTDD